jgi:hypothetical protein
MRTNLPPIESNTDSAAKTKLFFDEYGQSPLEFSANDVESAIGFFMNNGFDRDAAEITSAVVLRQAKLESIPVFQLIDQLKTLDGVKLSAMVAEILNNNRPSSSALGYKAANSDDQFKIRNIAA